MSERGKHGNDLPVEALRVAGTSPAARLGALDWRLSENGCLITLKPLLFNQGLITRAERRDGFRGAPLAPTDELDFWDEGWMYATLGEAALAYLEWDGVGTPPGTITKTYPARK